MPRLTEFITAADVGDDKHHATFHQRQTGDGEAGIHAEAVRSVAIEETWRGAIELHALLVEHRQGHAGVVARSDPAPLGDIARGIVPPENRGAFHEGLNMAAYQKLPIIYVCENNVYGASTPYNKTTLVEDVAERVKSYGMRSKIVDGMNVVEVYLAAKEAKESILNGEGPILIEAKTYRFAGHSRGDAKKYRTKEEEEYWKNLDPIERMKDSLFDNNLLDNESYALILKDIQVEIDDAVLFAQQSNFPPVEDAFVDAYATKMNSPLDVQL